MAADVTVRIFQSGLSDIDDQAETFMSKLGDEMLVRTQRLVPKRTWALHDSLTKEVERAEHVIVVSVGVDPSARGVEPGAADPADYVTDVELGNSRQAPQPFLKPALMQTIASIR